METLTNPKEKDLSELEEYSDKSFFSYLKFKQLPENLISFIMYGIALVHEVQSEEKQTISTKDGMAAVKKYISSLARYSQGPFLYCLYGSGDVPQAFCRASAVRNGIFVLNKKVSDILCENNQFSGIVTENTVIKSKYLVSNAQHFYSFVENTEPCTMRCVCIIDRSIVEENNFLYVVVPPNSFGNEYSINMFQIDYTLKVVPNGKYLIYISTKYTENSKSIISGLIDQFFNKEITENGKPNLLQVALYTVNKSVYKNIIPDNIFTVKEPDETVAFDNSLIQAQEIFKKMFPDQEFLPEIEESLQ